MEGTRGLDANNVQNVANGKPGTGKTVFIDKPGEIMGQPIDKLLREQQISELARAQTAENYKNHAVERSRPDIQSDDEPIEYSGLDRSCDNYYGIGE